MKASTVSVPLLCCSAPRAVRIIAVFALPSRCAARVICCIETPVIRSICSGQQEASTRLSAGKLVVRSRDELRVEQVVSRGDMQQAVGEREIGARRDLQMQGGVLRGRRPARIDDDQFAAALPLGLEILHDRRHGLGGVAADQQNHLRAGDVFERKRHARGPRRTP